MPTTRTPIRPDAHLTVATCLAVWPSLTSIFVQHNMACPGCDMAELMTVAEAAEVYGKDVEAFVGELRQAGGD